MSKRAKIFMNGRSQAVRLPKEYRFECEEVYVRKLGDSLILSATEPGWDAFFDEPTAFSEEYLAERTDAPPQKRVEL